MGKKFLIVRGFGLGPGLGDATPGQERDDIPSHLVNRLTAQAKIRELAAPADETAKAAALAQAHAELIEQIRNAASATELEKLLSEDPEIVAAYERRSAELEEEEGRQEAAQIMKGLEASQNEEGAIALLSAAKSAVALDLLKEEISTQETGLHAAIDGRLAELTELDEPHH